MVQFHVLGLYTYVLYIMLEAGVEWIYMGAIMFPCSYVHVCETGLVSGEGSYHRHKRGYSSRELNIYNGVFTAPYYEYVFLSCYEAVSNFWNLNRR